MGEPERLGVERIGAYRVDRILGTGAFATVYLAHDEALDVPVAIKLLAENWSHDPEIRRRFVEEARLLRRADNERVVRVHVVGEVSTGRPYFVMDWADRGTLAERVAERRERAQAFSAVLALLDTMARPGTRLDEYADRRLQNQVDAVRVYSRIAHASGLVALAALGTQAAQLGPLEELPNSIRRGFLPTRCDFWQRTGRNSSR